MKNLLIVPLLSAILAVSLAKRCRRLLRSMLLQPLCPVLRGELLRREAAMLHGDEDLQRSGVRAAMLHLLQDLLRDSL